MVAGFGVLTFMGLGLGCSVGRCKLNRRAWLREASNGHMGMPSQSATTDTAQPLLLTHITSSLAPPHTLNLTSPPTRLPCLCTSNSDLELALLYGQPLTVPLLFHIASSHPPLTSPNPHTVGDAHLQPAAPPDPVRAPRPHLPPSSVPCALFEL